MNPERRIEELERRVEYLELMLRGKGGSLGVTVNSRLVVQDEAGVVRLQLGVTPHDGVSFILTDKERKDRMWIVIKPDGRPEITWVDDDGVERDLIGSKSP